MAEPNEPGSWSRRDVLRVLASTATGAMLPGCSVPGIPTRGPEMEPRLTARPSPPTTQGTSGKTRFPVPDSTAVIYVPPNVDSTTATGLVVFLHGALRNVDFFVEGHRPSADRAGVLVLAPYATLGTWDAINTRFSNDVRVLDAALTWAFERWTIDPARIAMSGFSDGGTYSLAMGRANGDLFTKVVAYSPGFLIEVDGVGRPPILITHGTQDTVLPIEQTSRRIVPALRQLGYSVDYREFEGPHAVRLSAMEELVESLGTQPR